MNIPTPDNSIMHVIDIGRLKGRIHFYEMRVLGQKHFFIFCQRKLWHPIIGLN